MQEFSLTIFGSITHPGCHSLQQGKALDANILSPELNQGDMILQRFAKNTGCNNNIHNRSCSQGLQGESMVDQERVRLGKGRLILEK